MSVIVVFLRPLGLRLGSPTKTWPAGTYTSNAGDYFHRTVPWNPALTDTVVGAACNTNNPIATGSRIVAMSFCEPRS